MDKIEALATHLEADSAPLEETPQRWGPHPVGYRNRPDLGRVRRKAIYGAMLILTPILALAFSPIPVLACALWLVFLALLLMAQVFERSDQLTAEDELLIFDSQRLDQILVRMWVEVDGVVRGVDRGVIWFDETGYYFHGHRSWFRIAKSDFLRPRRKRFFAIPPELDSFSDLILLEVRNPGSRLRIGLRKMQTGNSSHASAWPYTVSAQLESFLSSPELQQQPTCVPPTGFDPLYRTLDHLHIRVTDSVFAALGLGIVAMVFVGARGDPGVYGLLLIAGSILCLPLRRFLCLARAIRLRRKAKKSMRA
jgi:hypothetical protein